MKSIGQYNWDSLQKFVRDKELDEKTLSELRSAVGRCNKKGVLMGQRDMYGLCRVCTQVGLNEIVLDAIMLFNLME